jgi:tripeptide aminopeptidase
MRAPDKSAKHRPGENTMRGGTGEPLSDKRSLRLVIDLMAIPGLSGEEQQVADFIQQTLVDAGADPNHIRTDSANRRTLLDGQLGNLIYKMPATTRGPRRMFSAHMDTVPICAGCRPVREGQFIRSADPSTGLGADDRAGVAVTLSTALALLENPVPHPSLTFCWFVQEEIGLQGARCLSKSALGRPQLAFNWDGGNPYKLTIGATGGYRMEIEVRGIASHAGGAPEWGVSAIAIAGIAIAELTRNGWHGQIVKGRKCGTSNIGVIRGGNATNVVADQVNLRAEARSHDAKFRERIVAEIEKAFRKAVREVKNVAGKTGSVVFDGTLDYEAFQLNADDEVVETAARAVTAVGGQFLHYVANGGVDANWTNRHGIPTVTLGCGQVLPHMTTEALDIEQFHQAIRVAYQLATCPTE